LAHHDHDSSGDAGMSCTCPRDPQLPSLTSPLPRDLDTQSEGCLPSRVAVQKENGEDNIISKQYQSCRDNEPSAIAVGISFQQYSIKQHTSWRYSTAWLFSQTANSTLLVGGGDHQHDNMIVLPALNVG
jgi:hypothetical protein